MNKLLIVLSCLLVESVNQTESVRVYLIGDSTMSIKEKRAYPETGWGMPFADFFDSTVVVDNRAKNGRSTRTFIEEGLWQSVADNLKQGDYVFMQFGHNDESVEKVDRYTSPSDYKKNLIRFITETKNKKAIPVVLSPVTRRKFVNGTIQQTHEVYSKLAEDVAVSHNVTFIDLDTKSRALLQTFGEEHSAVLFLQLKPNEHPNYPEGKNDNTHFNELGARLIAQLVLEEIRNQQLAVSSRIIKPSKK